QTARQQLGGELLPPAEAAQLWRGLRDQTQPFFAQARTLWRLSVPSSAASIAGGGAQLIEWGGALRWYASAMPASVMRERAAAAGGTALHWRGAAAGARFHSLAPAVVAIHRRLKA